jgi:hypothetical protein
MLRRLRQRVHAHFPTSLDAAKNFNDLPLLGAQPSIAGSASDHTVKKTVDTIISESGLPSPLRNNLPSFSPSPPHIIDREAAMAPINSGTHTTQTDQSPSPDPYANFFSSGVALDAAWSTPHLKMFQDNSGGGVPFPWPGGHVWQPSLPEGEINAPVENFSPTATLSATEAGQWNQFLDRLGVWE